MQVDHPKTDARPPHIPQSWKWCDRCKKYECELLRCACGRCYYEAKYVPDDQFPLFLCACGETLFWD